MVEEQRSAQGKNARARLGFAAVSPAACALHRQPALCVCRALAIGTRLQGGLTPARGGLTPESSGTRAKTPLVTIHNRVGVSVSVSSCYMVSDVASAPAAAGDAAAAMVQLLLLLQRPAIFCKYLLTWSKRWGRCSQVGGLTALPIGSQVLASVGQHHCDAFKLPICGSRR